VAGDSISVLDRKTKALFCLQAYNKRDDVYAVPGSAANIFNMFY
jgi:hypothetical protein